MNLVAVIIILAVIIIIIVVAEMVADLAEDYLAAAVVAVGFGFYSFYSLAEEEVAEDFSSNLNNLKDDTVK